MKRLGTMAAFVLLHHFHASVSLACGPTPFLLSALLPIEDATNVGIDAVLTASVNYGGPLHFELRRVNEGESSSSLPSTVDGGSPDDSGADANVVDVEVECREATWGGHLCLAKPTSVLEANTDYEWSAAVEIEEGQDPGYFAPTPWRRFRTAATTSPTQAISLSADVSRHDRYTEDLCGIDHHAVLNIGAEGVEDPVVVHIRDVTPSYVMEPLVMTRDEVREWTLYLLPDCVQIEAIDVTGRLASALEVCPQEILPATYHDASGNVVAPPAASGSTDVGNPSHEIDRATDNGHDHLEQRGVNESRGGCTVVPANAGASPLAWVALGLVAFSIRRRPRAGEPR